VTSSPLTFDEFYAAYLREHRHPVNRALHFAAKVSMVAAALVAVATTSLVALVLVPIAAVAPCWVGHWLFEHNRPTAFGRPGASLLGALADRLMGRAGSGSGRPWYSFAADVRMCGEMLGIRRRRPH
jgi:hypothetical protein